jgi:acetyl esterase/lipase
MRKGCKIARVAFGCLAAALAMNLRAGGTAAEAPSRTIPSRNIPMPDTVSPALQKVLGEAPEILQELQTPAGQKRLSDEMRGQVAKMRDRLGVTVTRQMIGGISSFVVTPRVIQPKNRHRLLVGLHGGGFYDFNGEAELLDIEALEMASVTGIKVIEVDYRGLPDHPFPAAIDDAVDVWKAVIKQVKPHNIAVFGTSEGGNLVLCLVQRAKLDGLPIPGAIYSGSPEADLSKTGDTYYANAGVDDYISYEVLAPEIGLYAQGRDLKDPQLSPVYGDFSGFPPAFLVSGTRDLFLSNTVRVQKKLLRAGVPTVLEVEEGQPHAAYLWAAMVDAPEVAELYTHIAQFFDTHLGH